jgi:parallel beta-helix repeat protein
MKKKIFTEFMILFVCLSTLSAGGVSAEHHSMNRGNIFYVGGSGPGNFTSIQVAINAASDGDTVFVYDESSPYYENIVINKSIDLIGENRNTTIIDGSKIGCVLTLLAEGIKISNFTIQNAGFHENDDLAGILIQSNFNLITENIITTNENNENGYGILLINSSFNIILNNIIQNNYHAGIQTRGGNNNSIVHNLITNNLFGSIQIGWSYNNLISENKISDALCIALLESFNNSILKNNIISYGFALLITNSTNNLIQQNNFIKKHRNAVFIYNAYCISINKKINNIWFQNYWNKPKILPKPIICISLINNKKIIHIEFDLFPTQKPYIIQ